MSFAVMVMIRVPCPPCVPDLSGTVVLATRQGQPAILKFPLDALVIPLDPTEAWFSGKLAV